ncbi:MAG TPA: UvrD-helicase domain-containing protein [Xanthomonadaceae bacterium]|nr:UvrD-helicase domain-containing protein [Xanthomonadaceae bacterium]
MSRFPLNPAQAEAVRYCDGPLLVLAGAGSGKTRVITEKIGHLVDRKGVDPARIAAITFTNKAANEMRDRVGRRVGAAARDALTVSTFHALGLRFLQQEHEVAGLRRGFSVFDADDSAALIKDLAPKGIGQEALDQLRHLVSRAKNVGLAPEGAAEQARAPREREAADLYAAYQQRLAAFNAVDFDDLIRLPLALLESDHALLARWQARHVHLLVDEYQDTNAAQYGLLRLLAGGGCPFTVVGDDDQSIYAWRGADPGNLTTLKHDFPALKVVALEQNYRSTRRVLRVANALIAHNPHLFEKKLWSGLGEGEPVRVLPCRDPEHEAECIVADLVHRAQAERRPWSDFAVLYRGNHQARTIERALRLAEVPYHLSGGTAYFDRIEIKDLIGYLRLIVNPDDDAAFLRVVNTPRREIGATTLERLGKLAAGRGLSLLRTASSLDALRALPPRPAVALGDFVRMIEGLSARARRDPAADIARAVYKAVDYGRHLDEGSRDAAQAERRRGFVEEFLTFLEAGERATATLAAQLALLSRNDDERRGEAVRLMTLHGSKGLEFPVVYLIGLEEGVLPHESSLHEGQVEEERRLFYVGITRAREALSLSYVESRRRFGKLEKVTPSRFLAELPEADLDWKGRDSKADEARSREMARSHLDRLKALLAG